NWLKRLRCRQSSRSMRRSNFRLALETLEDRQLLSITDMTALAQQFSPHAGPTTLYLNFDGGKVSYDGHTESISPFQSMPGQNRGYSHQPNSDPYDLAFVDPVGHDAAGAWVTVWDDTFISEAVSHEAGHTFGLEHVLTGDGSGNWSFNNRPDIMSYDAPNQH